MVIFDFLAGAAGGVVTFVLGLLGLVLGVFGIAI
jgi:hypothetical protein